MSKKFWVSQIDVKQSPGFSLGSFPPIQKLGSSLNVIWGPNAVGKSTLSRAMRSLIWKTSRDEELMVEGTLVNDNETWKLSNSLGRLTQTRLTDNKEITLPGRNDELSESYWFTLHELLQENGGHTGTFLQEVRTRMQGGVDIDKACVEAGGIDSFSRRTINQAKRVKEADERLKKIIETQNEYRHIQDSIKTLKDEIAKREALTQKKETLIEASSLIETQRKIQHHQEALTTYHESIKYVDKTSFQRSQELKETKESMHSNVDEATRVLRERKTALSSCQIEDEKINDVDLIHQLKYSFAAYEEAVQQKETSHKDLVKKTSTLEKWESEHTWLIDEAPEKRTLKDSITTLKTLASECEPLRCRVASLTHLCAQLGEIEEIHHCKEDLITLSVHLSDVIDLSSKLQGTSEYLHMEKWGKKGIIFSSLVILAIASFIGITVHPLSFLVGGVLLLTMLSFIIPSEKKNPDYNRAKSELEKKQTDLEKEFTQLDRGMPSSWDMAQWRELLHSLGKEIQDIYLVEQQNQKIKRADKERNEAIIDLTTWTQKWEQAVRDIGLPTNDSRLDGAQFFHFAQRLERWSDYKIEKEQASRAFSSAEHQEKEVLEAIQKLMGTTETHFPTLKGKNESLIERLQEAKRLYINIKDDVEKLIQATNKYNEAENALQKFWQDTHLNVGDEITLKELSLLCDEYSGVKREVKFYSDDYTAASREHSKAFELSTTISLDEINAELLIIESSLESILKKNNELGGLETTYESLITSSQLSEAELEKEQSLSALHVFRENEVMGRMINNVADSIKEESEQKFQPHVLKSASTWLEDITNYRYQLAANDEGFFVTDTRQRANYTIDQLSSGTRIQLLFSIRMAFITLQEETSGVHLPIFLDELLANSDDERAHDIILAIGTIAKERQVCYFTAQRDEVEKLKAIAGDDITVIQLEDEKRHFKADTTPLKPFSFKSIHVVEPLDDYYAYGKALRVPGASLWDPISNHHSWHLCNDGPTLYSFLKKGLVSIGQIMASTQNQDSLLLLRFTVLERAQKDARRGRSRKLHMQDLYDPDISLNQNATYWEQIQQVVGDGVSGKELLQAIEEKKIKRLHGSTLEILTSWLISNEFISEETPKSENEILDDLFVQFEGLIIASLEHHIVARWLHSALS